MAAAPSGDEEPVQEEQPDHNTCVICLEPCEPGSQEYPSEALPCAHVVPWSETFNVGCLQAAEGFAAPASTPRSAEQNSVLAPARKAHPILIPVRQSTNCTQKKNMKFLTQNPAKKQSQTRPKNGGSNDSEGWYPFWEC